MKRMRQEILSKELKKKRKAIDLVDRKLLTLLNQRLRTALEIGKVKKETGKKIYDPKREKEVLEKLRTRNRGPLRNKDLATVFRTIMSVCRRFQK